jgi:hypothetical protein
MTSVYNLRTRQVPRKETQKVPNNTTDTSTPQRKPQQSTQEPTDDQSESKSKTLANIHYVLNYLWDCTIQPPRFGTVFGFKQDQYDQIWNMVQKAKHIPLFEATSYINEHLARVDVVVQATKDLSKECRKMLCENDIRAILGPEGIPYLYAVMKDHPKFIEVVINKYNEKEGHYITKDWWIQSRQMIGL